MRSTILGENIAYFKGVRHDSKIFWSPISEIEWKSQIILGQKLGQPTRSVITIWVSSFSLASLLGLPNKLNGKLCSHGPRRIKIVHQQISHVLWEKLRPVIGTKCCISNNDKHVFQNLKDSKASTGAKKGWPKIRGRQYLRCLELWSSSCSWSLWFYLS